MEISDGSISMVTHYFDESFLRTEEDYGNTYSKSHLSDSIVEDAIFGMLPKTKLGKQMYRKLKVYAGDKHPHAAQKPVPLTVA